MNDILFGFLWYQIIASIGVKYGYHHYWAHKSFDAPVWYEWISLYLGLFAGIRSPIGWIGVHRIHHAYADTKKDPHSPIHVGYWKALTSTWTVPNIPRKYVKDIISNPRIKFVHKNAKILWLGTGLILLIDYQLFLIFWLYPLVFGYIGFGLLNTLGHKNGKPSNSIITSIFTFNEGMHKGHHE